MDVISNLTTKIISILSKNSDKIDLPIDETSQLLFHDFYPTDQYNEGKNNYIRDLISRKCAYHYFINIPKVVQKINSENRSMIRVNLQGSEVNNQILEISNKLIFFTKGLIFQSRESLDEKVLDINWANNYHRYEIDCHIIEPNLLKSMLNEIYSANLLHNIIYLPYISCWHDPVSERYSEETGHIKQIREANSRLELLPSVISQDPPIIRDSKHKKKSVVVELPYIEVNSLLSLKNLSNELKSLNYYHKNMENFLKQCVSSDESIQKVAKEINEKEIVKRASELKQKFIELPNNLIRKYKGNLKFFKLELVFLFRENNLLNMFLKIIKN